MAKPRRSGFCHRLPEEVVVDVNVPQERYADILSDTSVRLCPDTRPGYCVDASVAAIIPVGNATARAFRVRLQADGPVDGLLPGTSAVAEFSISAANGKPRLLISRDALLRHPDGDYSVFVTAQDKSQPTQDHGGPRVFRSDRSCRGPATGRQGGDSRQ